MGCKQSPRRWTTQGDTPKKVIDPERYFAKRASMSPIGSRERERLLREDCRSLHYAPALDFL
jgi:hypothetical protein